ncbi:MAG: RIP metalloprotease RseP [Acidobacteriota bacterium]|nr:RIP metalloprotease RseP [Acidobacteriota bacterium]
MHSLLVSVAAFIVLVGIMVIVHEFGHFAVAKLCGVRVEAFSVGFGPRLFGVKYGDTDYKVCLLPLGGYVKMTGETPDQITGPTTEGLAEDPGAFTSHPRWQRMLIGAAGPIANFILAFFLMVFYFGWINEVPYVQPTTIEWVNPTSPAAQAGIKPGDVIQKFGTLTDPDLEKVLDAADKDAGKSIPVTVQRNGQTFTTTLPVKNEADDSGVELPNTGLYFHYVEGPIKVDQTLSDSPASRAGMQAGDQIVAVDGYAFHTLDPLIEYLQEGKGKPIALTIQRNNELLPQPLIVHPEKQNAGWRLGFMAMQPNEPKMILRPMKFGDAVSASSDYCVQASTMIVQVLHKLFTRQASVKELSGPVGIARVAGQAAETKYWSPKFSLAAGISLNLGILNLLPFPILDGGLILLLLIESALRHDISIVVKERIYQAAFVVLVMFFVYVSFNDVAKLPIFTHMKH